jgi:hypothetical protein
LKSCYSKMRTWTSFVKICTVSNCKFKANFMTFWHYTTCFLLQKLLESVKSSSDTFWEISISILAANLILGRFYFITTVKTDIFIVQNFETSTLSKFFIYFISIGGHNCITTFNVLFWLLSLQYTYVSLKPYGAFDEANSKDVCIRVWKLHHHIFFMSLLSLSPYWSALDFWQIEFENSS